MRVGVDQRAVGGFKRAARRPLHRGLPGWGRGRRPGTKVVWGYSQDWEDQAKCKELALNQIAAGSKVVFQVAGGCGLGALSAAKDERVWGIGVDGDQSFLGPHVLTSALKGVDSAVFLTIKALEDGTFKGGRNTVFGIDQDGVGLGTLSPKANAGRRGDREGRARARRRRDHGHPDDAQLTDVEGRGTAPPLPSPVAYAVRTE